MQPLTVPSDVINTSAVPDHMVVDYSDAPSLKSVARGLHALLGDTQTAANRRALESLIPRVEMLAESLCAPVSEGDFREESRRKTLAR